MKTKHLIALAGCAALSTGVAGCGSSESSTDKPQLSAEQQVQAVQKAPNVSEAEKARTLADMERRRAEAADKQRQHQSGGAPKP